GDEFIALKAITNEPAFALGLRRESSGGQTPVPAEQTPSAIEHRRRRQPQQPAVDRRALRRTQRSPYARVDRAPDLQTRQSVPDECRPARSLREARARQRPRATLPRPQSHRGKPNPP